MNPSRRQILAALGGTLAAPALARVARTSRKVAGNYVPGLQLYTLRADLADDFEGTLARVAQLGYVEVEMFNSFGHSAREVRAMLDRHGLRSPSGHTLLKPLREDLDSLIEDCLALGHQYLVLAFLLPGERQTLDDYRQLADTLGDASERCRAAGLRLGYHNHDFEFVPIEGTLPFDVLYQRLSAEELAFELDLYWCSKAGIDPIEILQRDPERFPMVHVKDMDDTPAKAFTEVGSGVIDFAAIFRHNGAAGIRHFFVEQDVIRGDRFESVTRSLAGFRAAMSAAQNSERSAR